MSFTLRCISAVAALALLLLPLAAAQAEQLTLRSLVEPASDKVRLSDVFVEPAEGSSGAPFPEARRIFGERAALIPLWEIRSVLSKSERRVPVLVGRRLRYIPADATHDERLLLRGILEALERRGSPEERTEVEIERIPSGVEAYFRSSTTQETAVQGGTLQAEASFSPGGGAESADGSGTQRRRFVLRSGGEVLGVCPVTVYPYRTVAAAKRSLEAGEVVQLGQLPRVSAAAAELEKPAGEYPLRGRYRVNRSIPATRPLEASMLTAEPAVKASSQVRVTLRGNGIELRVGGRALRSGEVGETVPVRLATGARLDARVTSRGTLEIER